MPRPSRRLSNGAGCRLTSDRLLALDQARRDALTAAQEVQARRNALSREIGQRKVRGEDACEMLAEVARCKQAQAELEGRATSAEAELQQALALNPEISPRTTCLMGMTNRRMSSCAAGASRGPSASRRRSISCSARRSG